MAEHSTVNRRVTGSSPVGGANKTHMFCYLHASLAQMVEQAICNRQVASSILVRGSRTPTVLCGVLAPHHRENMPSAVVMSSHFSFQIFHHN